MTTVNVFSALTTIMSQIWGVFGTCSTTIMSNALLYVPVLISLAGGLIFFAISIIRKLGIRGVSSGGGKRRFGR